MTALWDIAEFVRRMRRQLRFGELSRAPLRLLRFELRGETAECEWMARPADPWDAHLAPAVKRENQTLQTLRDAITVRRLLFDALSQVRVAKVRVYREAPKEAMDLVITGTVAREDKVSSKVSSVVMRAKLFGLHFVLQEGGLVPLQVEKRRLSFAT